MTFYPDLVAALEEWRRVIGSDNVLTESSKLSQAGTATFATHQTVLAILRPADSLEVQQCLQVANQFAIPLYPISTGKNWGYGSGVPVEDNVLLDLGRLNRILDYNEELAYVTLEPGVTQRQLYDFLQKQGGRLWLDATGSSPDCSIVGNTLERGFGHTPYGDHFAQVGGLEVILPDGVKLHTGLSRFANAQAANVYRWGVGPGLDGLFSQSNLGIVTKMTLWLMPAPEHFGAFYFSVERDDQLGAVIEALRPLRLNGTLRSAVHIANAYKVVSALQTYPWKATGGQTPLPPETLAQLARKYDFKAWSGSGGLYGTKTQVREGYRLIKEALKGKVCKLQFVDDSKLKLARRLARPYQWVSGVNLHRMLKLAEPVYGLLKGVPTSSQLASVYWRKREGLEGLTNTAALNPDRDGCGLIWCAPVASLSGVHATILNRLAIDTLRERNFEPIISMTLLTERSLSCVINISYDRAVPGEDERAMNCYETLLGRLVEKGYYPYRLGIQSMDRLDNSDGYNKVLKVLKEALDPRQIVAPGRYAFRSNAPTLQQAAKQEG